MATLGELAVNVVAKTQKFSKGMKRAEKTVTGFTKRIKSFRSGISSLNTAFVTLGATLGAGFVVRQLTKFNEQIFKLGQQSAQLGIATDRLQTLQLAASRAGIEVDTFTTSLQRMIRRVSDASRGKNEALAETMQSMGLSARELVRLDPADQFERISAALVNVPDEDKVSTAFAFFDSEGVGNIKLAGENFAAFRQELEQQGALVTEQEAAAAANFADSMDRIAKFATRIGQKIVIDITPGLTRGLARIEQILGIQPDDTRRGLPTPDINRAALETLGVDMGVGEAELSRSGVINPMRSVFREMMSGELEGLPPNHPWRRIEKGQDKQVRLQQTTNVLLQQSLTQESTMVTIPQ